MVTCILKPYLHHLLQTPIVPILFKIIQLPSRPIYGILQTQPGAEGKAHFGSSVKLLGIILNLLTRQREGPAQRLENGWKKRLNDDWLTGAAPWVTSPTTSWNYYSPEFNAPRMKIELPLFLLAGKSFFAPSARLFLLCPIVIRGAQTNQHLRCNSTRFFGYKEPIPGRP